jgi:adenylate cyclase
MPQSPPPSFPFGSVGEIIRSHRLVQGMTVEQLAEAAHIAPSAIRAMENGSRVAPPKEMLKSLADTLHLDDDDRDALMLAAEMSSPFLTGIFSPANTATLPPPLSASIIVFLIADVRGYTHFTQDHGDDAAARLTTKFADLARSVIEQWDGRVIELRGDEALIVFGSVRQALLAALALQERFIAETASAPETPLNVGIGLDVGEATPVDEGGYRGAALNRAARLCSMAGAGDVLVTTGLVYLAPIVEGVAFLGRGAMTLKGFDAPVEVLAVTRKDV